MTIGPIDHVAVVVRSIDESLPRYAALFGLQPAGPIHELPAQRVRVCFLPTGPEPAARVELIQPTDSDSGVARYLAAHGEGLHHVCLRSSDLPSDLAALAAREAELIDAAPRPGADGEVAFIHPRTLNGVLWELISPSSEALTPHGGRLVFRLGTADDIGAALSVYERSNLARRRGDWPNRGTRMAQVGDRLRDPETWYLVAEEGGSAIAMAAAQPLRAHDGKGPVTPGALFLNLLFVVPECWGQGIGGVLLDAVIDEAARRGYTSMQLWTDEADNGRAHRLYRRRGLAPSGRRRLHEGVLIGEWIIRLPSTPG